MKSCAILKQKGGENVEIFDRIMNSRMMEYIPGMLICIILLGLGVFHFWKARKVEKYEKKELIANGVFCFCIVLPFAVLIPLRRLKAQLIYACFFPILGNVYSILNEYIARKRCTVPVLAKYIGYDRTENGNRYVPIFQYTFHGEQIEQPSILFYPGKILHRLFEKGEEYTVFVNPNMPRRCMDKRWFPLAHTIFELTFWIAVFCIACIEIHAMV